MVKEDPRDPARPNLFYIPELDPPPPTSLPESEGTHFVDFTHNKAKISGDLWRQNLSEPNHVMGHTKPHTLPEQDFVQILQNASPTFVPIGDNTNREYPTDLSSDYNNKIRVNKHTSPYLYKGNNDGAQKSQWPAVAALGEPVRATLERTNTPDLRQLITNCILYIEKSDKKEPRLFIKIRQVLENALSGLISRDSLLYQDPEDPNTKRSRMVLEKIVFEMRDRKVLIEKATRESLTQDEAFYRDLDYLLFCLQDSTPEKWVPNHPASETFVSDLIRYLKHFNLEPVSPISSEFTLFLRDLLQLILAKENLHDRLSRLVAVVPHQMSTSVKNTFKKVAKRGWKKVTGKTLDATIADQYTSQKAYEKNIPQRSDKLDTTDQTIFDLTSKIEGGEQKLNHAKAEYQSRPDIIKIAIMLYLNDDNGMVKTLAEKKIILQNAYRYYQTTSSLNHGVTLDQAISIDLQNARILIKLLQLNNHPKRLAELIRFINK